MIFKKQYEYVLFFNFNTNYSVQRTHCFCFIINFALL